jgi:transposase
MAPNFQPYEPNQILMMPPAISDWVADGSLARFVNDAVEHMDERGELAAFYAAYRSDGVGAAAFHPVLMLKVLLYCYCHGLTSSRKIAAAHENDVAVRYLSANQQPDFRTIALFRSRHLEALDSLFVKILVLCREAGLAKLGRVALDGRKVAGAAALDQNRTLEGIRREVAGLLEKAEQEDRAEDGLHGEASRGDELPEGLRTKGGRLARLRAAQERLEAKACAERSKQETKIEERQAEEERTGRKKRGRKPRTPEAVVDNEAKANVTDPDSRILKTRSHGFIQGYNGQAMVDCGSQVIVTQGLTQEENDQHQLAPMLAACEEQAGRPPEELLADAGYGIEENLRLETERTEFFVATQKDYKMRKALADAAKGPDGAPGQNACEAVEADGGASKTEPAARTSAVAPALDDAVGGNAGTVAAQDESVGENAGAVETLGTNETAEPGESARARMERKLKTERGREAYRQRGSTVEPVFGQMVTSGLVRFALRGFARTAAEWSLWCSVHNLKKLWRSGWKAPKLGLRFPQAAGQVAQGTG